ncbi:MAG: aminodeoxychorismate lyase [Proteobacteria bacterium]|nr:aminodeoxychorismate lyase [Pseudomonadota bacterium]
MMLWIDGVEAPAGVLDRGLEFGDGLFETLAVADGRPRRLERHLARLALGCGRLGIAAPDPATLAAELRHAAAQPGTGVVKLIVTRGEGGTGYAADPGRAPCRRVAALPARARAGDPAAQGVAVVTLATRLAEQPLLAGLKHLNRLEQVLARAELARSPAAAEGLMLDVHGRLVCGTMTNVYLVTHGRVVTPSLARAGVAGVLRAELLEGWAGAGTPCEIRDVEPAEIATATEVFVSNALIGVWPVVNVDGRPLPVGPVTRAAQARAAAA